jgi:hypothetical protein
MATTEAVCQEVGCRWRREFTLKLGQLPSTRCSYELKKHRNSPDCAGSAAKAQAADARRAVASGVGVAIANRIAAASAAPMPDSYEDYGFVGANDDVDMMHDEDVPDHSAAAGADAPPPQQPPFVHTRDTW